MPKANSNHSRQPATTKASKNGKEKKEKKPKEKEEESAEPVLDLIGALPNEVVNIVSATH